MTDIGSFRHLIELWPTTEAFARDVKRYAPADRKGPPARDWYRNDRIPEPWFDSVLKAAHERGFEEVNYRLLSGLYRRRTNP